ncbi:hypothetical protein MJO29_001178 [Puccinia striiformis f. sp. tritici]|nr:hypothetical protein MJO29_001178 [Puccinia striiformis f. sp. tritici]
MRPVVKPGPAYFPAVSLLLNHSTVWLAQPQVHRAEKVEIEINDYRTMNPSPNLNGCPRL